MNDALVAASVVLLAVPGAGLTGASVYALARRGRTTGLSPRTALARAGTYAALALILLAAAWTGIAGIAVLFGGLGAIALLEWGRLFDLPRHHRIALVGAHLVVIGTIAAIGIAATPVLVGGLVLVGVAWPVIRADTGRAIRDLGYAAVGMIVVTVMLAHAVALVYEEGSPGIALLIALASACAGSDVGAYIVGRRFGRHRLAPNLSPNKTVEGLAGNVVGAALTLALFIPAIVPTFGWGVWVALIAVVAAGAVWGDLLESAAKREADVKDAGDWLPGFGGILDRIDSLLVVVALAYWLVRFSGDAA